MTQPSQDRRLHPRITVTAGVPRLQPPFALRDVSRGGFCLESANHFTIGDHESFQFTVPGHPPITLGGTVRHHLRLNHPDAASTFLAGFEFDPLTEEQMQALELLLAEARHSLSA